MVKPIPKPRFSDWLTHEWQHPSYWQWVLRPWAWLYASLLILRKYAYRSGLLHTTSFSVPIIVVGNLTVGGTGKTPLVIELAHQLRAAGKFPGIISRGYTGHHTRPIAVTVDSDPKQCGDEALLLAQRTQVPIWVGHQRPAVAKALLNAHPKIDVLISDDGLQHSSLGRYIEIIVIDGSRGFGNGQLLPAGPLREPSSRLEFADIILVNQTSTLHPSIRHLPPHHTMHFTPSCIYALKSPSHTVKIDYFHDTALHAIAGIGHPQRFFDQLHAAGLSFTAHPFPDHYDFQANELNFEGNLLMTEKDAVKCRKFATDQMWVWPVSAQIDTTLLPKILTLLDAFHGQ